MHTFARLAGLMILMATTACSTVMEGRSQNISIDTLPSGASCLIKDNDIVLARVQTPAVATIGKSKNDILVECSKDGYAVNRQRNRADMAISSIGNMAFGKLSVVGDIVDTASGAAHKYDSRVFMALTPLPPVARIDAPEVAASANYATMPPSEITENLTRMLTSRNVVVTHQSAEEVIRQLISGAPVQVESQISAAAENPPPTVVAQLLNSGYHQAD